MSRLGEALVLGLNRLFPRLQIHEELRSALADSDAHFRWEYEDGVRVFDDFAPYNHLAGAEVLDVGSGSGAKALFYARQGARSVTGLELEPIHVQRAWQFTRDAPHRLRFVVGDAAAMSLPSNRFDVVISVNTLEHVRRPLSVLRECLRVARPGGRLLIRFPPYYSAWGAHLDRWIAFPWPHILFSERALIGAVNRLEELERLNERYPAFAQLDLRGLDSFPHVNRLTLRDFRSMLAQVPVRVLDLRLIPSGAVFLTRQGRRAGMPGALARGARCLLGGLRLATQVPVLQELVTTKVVCILEKPGS